MDRTLHEMMSHFDHSYMFTFCYSSIDPIFLFDGIFQNSLIDRRDDYIEFITNVLNIASVVRCNKWPD